MGTDTPAKKVTVKSTTNSILYAFRHERDDDVQCCNLCWHKAGEFLEAHLKQLLAAHGVKGPR